MAGKEVKHVVGSKDAEVALVASPAGKYSKTNSVLLREISRKGFECVYVTTNKPFSTLAKQLKKEGVKAEKFFFIDCASSLVQGETKRKENVVFVMPQNLSGVSIAVNEALKTLDKPVVFFDSPGTLALYNPLNALEKFTHFLINRVRLEGAQGIFTADKGDMQKEFYVTLSKFCDEVVQA